MKSLLNAQYSLKKICAQTSDWRRITESIAEGLVFLLFKAVWIQCGRLFSTFSMKPILWTVEILPATQLFNKLLIRISDAWISSCYNRF